MTNKDFLTSWNDFWFRPQSASTLAVIRIATGSMLAYIHFVWMLRLGDFFGPHSFTSREWIQDLHSRDFTWSYLWYIDSTAFHFAHEVIAIVLSVLMCIGLFTQYVIPAIWFMTLMICHRMTGFLFGLDQIVMMLTMYLMIARSGDAYSVDQFLHYRLKNQNIATFEEGTSEVQLGNNIAPERNSPVNQPHLPTNLSAQNTIATRLIQIHLCIIYLIGGLGKMRGESWWDGSAVWLSAVSYEYQSADLTWIGNFPVLAALGAHVTLFWETFYCCLVWPKLTRPWVLAISVAVHGGIAIYLGMITFGWMMIVANIAFVSPETIHRVVFGLIQLFRPNHTHH